MYTHILVPTDGSELSDSALQQAIGLAARLEARITVLHVVHGVAPHLGAEGSFALGMFASNMAHVDYVETERAKKILGAAKEAAAKAGVQCDAVTAGGGTPYEAIIKQAGKLKCDLIVMASHGRRGLQALLLGSETIKVLTHSTIPVLVCRQHVAAIYHAMTEPGAQARSRSAGGEADHYPKT